MTNYKIQAKQNANNLQNISKDQKGKGNNISSCYRHVGVDRWDEIFLWQVVVDMIGNMCEYAIRIYGGNQF